MDPDGRRHDRVVKGGPAPPSKIGHGAKVTDLRVDKYERIEKEVNLLI